MPDIALDVEQALGRTAKGLATFYNLICAPRGFQLPMHMIPPVMALADRRIWNLIIVIGPGCLAGNTIVGYERTPGSGLKKVTIEKLYHLFNGLPWKVYREDLGIYVKARGWDNLGIIPTKTLSWIGDRLAMHEIKQVIQSGIKEVYRLETEGGNYIKASADHPFFVPGDKYKNLSDLVAGDTVFMRNNESYKGGRVKKEKEDRRAYTYSIPFHPYAYRNFVYDRDYKRLPTARLIVEADMNKLTLANFIEILRKKPEIAKVLKFIPPGNDVHHKNEDETDDRLDNLEVLTSEEHLARHAYEKQKNFGNVLLKEDTVKSITYAGKEMTYDIVMANPYRNFVASDFVVHNSGKSVLLSEIYPAWAIGHDPSSTIIGLSAGELLMQGFMKSVMSVIEFLPIYQQLFPAVRPDKGEGWSTERGLFVTGREIGNPDANYAAFGLDSKALTGKHGKTIIGDDIHDAENSASAEACFKVQERYYNTILGRADPRGARFIFAGRRWNTEDIYSHLMKSGDYVVLELPAEREGTDRLWYDISFPSDLDCVFSERLHKEPKKKVRNRVVLDEPVSVEKLLKQ